MTLEEYQTKAAALRNDYGDPVEEFEIQFIDGEAIDCDLAKAISLYQNTIAQYFDAVEDWDDHDKRIVISRRAIRRSRHATQKGLELRKIKNAVSISERPAEVEDRAVPGHHCRQHMLACVRGEWAI